MFRRSIRSVVSMDPYQLGHSDGSPFAKGRGSGVEVPPGQEPKLFPKVPHMNMVYAPTERRLDTAIFRAMFASSTRQARQFVIHGDVKVNGKKVKKSRPRRGSQLTTNLADDLSWLPFEPRRHVSS